MKTYLDVSELPPPALAAPYAEVEPCAAALNGGAPPQTSPPCRSMDFRCCASRSAALVPLPLRFPVAVDFLPPMRRFRRNAAAAAESVVSSAAAEVSNRRPIQNKIINISIIFVKYSVIQYNEK